MQRNLTPFLICLLAGLLLAWSLPAAAQTATQPDHLVINYVTLTPPEDQRDGKPTLEVFFTVMDAQGQPIIPQPEIETAQFLLDQQTELAIVGDPESPPYIAMLIDASGSMTDNIGQVRQAARNAIREAPASTPFVVYRFSSARTPMLEGDAFFSTDSRQVENAILAIDAEPNGVTCLYDAVYDTIKDLKREVPEQRARRAVIAFTDGVDELGDGLGRCSIRTLPEVVEEAQSTLDRSESPVPVYTIGLCNNGTRDPCTHTEPFDFQGESITDNPLKILASYTNGLSAMGALPDVNQAFKQIMDGLNSQSLAKADVFATRGRNQAVLDVTLSDGTMLQSPPFEFISEATYTQPPTVNIIKAELENEQYVLDMDLINPAAIGEITVGLVDGEKGTQVREKTFAQADIQANSADQAGFAIDASNLQVGLEYCFQVRAIDTAGQPLRNQTGLDAQNNNLDELCITHEPGIPYTIAQVSHNVRKATVLISLDISQDVEQQLLYDVSILDAETGQPVDDDPTPQGLLTGKQIEIPLPQKIQQAGQERSYIVEVTLREEGKAQGRRATYTVRLRPPGFFARVGMIIGNPFVLGFIFLVFAGVAGWIVYPKLRGNKQKPPPRPQIYNEKTVIPGRTAGVAPRRMELTLRVVQTPNASQKHNVVIKPTNVPFIIGRGATADLRITGDTEISREHAQIMVQGTTFTITDLRSRNGTFVNEKDTRKRLADQETIPLTRKTVVYLGTHTCLEIEPAVPQH